MTSPCPLREGSHREGRRAAPSGEHPVGPVVPMLRPRAVCCAQQRFGEFPAQVAHVLGLGAVVVEQVDGSGNFGALGGAEEPQQHPRDSVQQRPPGRGAQDPAGDSQDEVPQPTASVRTDHRRRVRRYRHRRVVVVDVLVGGVDVGLVHDHTAFPQGLFGEGDQCLDVRVGHLVGERRDLSAIGAEDPRYPGLIWTAASAKER